MSWDDEEFEVPTKNNTAAVASWEDEEDDEPLLDSWDIDEEAEAAKKKAEEAAKKAEKEALKAKQEAAKLQKKGKTADKKSDIDLADPRTRKELLKEAELNSDLNNAADLFDGLGIADVNEHPRAKANVASVKPVFDPNAPLETHPLFQPINKQDFEKLRKSVGPALTNLSKDSLLNYTSSLAIDLIRDLASPMSVENVRKVVSTLNLLIKEKEKQERQARLSKTGGTATGGAGKKKVKAAGKVGAGAFKKDDTFDTTNYDDFADDDFM